MTQKDFGNINPVETSGSALAAKLNEFRESIYTDHGGSQRPSYVMTGMRWTDYSGQNPVWKYFDGQDDITIGTFDTANNVFRIPALSEKVSKSGDSMSWILKLAFDYPQLWWGDAATGTGWRIIKDTPEGQVGNLVFQCSTDRWNAGANMKTALSMTPGGEVHVPIANVATQLKLPNYEAAGQFNGFLPGNGDAASYNTYNFSLSGWWGMAMRTYDGSINGYYDFRSGTWDVKGAFKVNGNPVPHAANKASASDIVAGTLNKFPDAAAVKDYLANNVPPSLGVGQSWQDVAASRQAGVTYQNTTGRTIVVSPAGWARYGFCEGQVSADGTNWLTPNRGQFVGTSDTTYYYAFPIFEVPPNHYYRLTAGNSYLGITKWLELR